MLHTSLNNLRNAVWPWNSPAWNPPMMSPHLQYYARNVCRAHTHMKRSTFWLPSSYYLYPHLCPTYQVLCEALGPASPLHTLMTWCSLTSLYLGMGSSFSLKCPSWLRSATLILTIWSPFHLRSFPCYSRDFPDFSPPLLFHCTWVPTAISVFVQYLFFSVWLISLNIMPSKSICIAANDEILFFFMAGSIRLLMDT